MSTSEPSDRPDRIRALFEELVGLPPEELEERLTAACGDDAAMREEVEALLAAADAEASDVRRALDALRPEAGNSLGGGEPVGGPGPPPDLRDALAERYVLEREIGRGGMATVYLAEDVRHHREVAVKVLDPDLGATIGGDRFLREIETAANLTHPHILPLHDSGEAGGFLYYVMPFVDGESLRARLDREPQLPVDEAVRITRDIAGALAYAHEQGVIHRDVKPANILLEAGHAVLADFGVAQAVAGADETRLTATGVSLGTPAYMSPEQAAGEHELDGRSDQYALACVLYEMLAGEPPFAGRRADNVVRQHLIAAATPVDAVRRSVPRGVAEAVARAMSKAPADRYGSVAEFGAALGGSGRRQEAAKRVGLWLVGAAALVAVVLVGVYALVSREGGQEAAVRIDHRVVVLPLANHTRESSLDNLGNLAADYLTTGLIDAAVTRVVDFKSIAAPAAAGQDGLSALYRTWPVSTGATLAVTGAYSTQGDSTEFRVRLVDPDGGFHGSAAVSQGSRENLNQTLRELQMSVVRTVAEVVTPGHTLALLIPERRVPNPEAVDVALEGWIVGLSESWGASIPYFVRANQLDPEYNVPLYLLTQALANVGRYVEADSVCGIMEPRALDLTRLERHQVTRVCAGVRGHPRAELEAMRHVADYVPNAVTMLGILNMVLNRPAEAAEHFAQYDPYVDTTSLLWAPIHWAYETRVHHALQDFEKELEVARIAREVDPERSSLIRAEIRALIALGRLDQAARMIAGRGAADGELRLVNNILDRVAREYAAHGHTQLATESWERVLAWHTTALTEGVATAESRRDIAETLLYLGRPDEARLLIESLAAEFPDNVADVGRLGVVRAMQGDTAGAQEVAETLRKWAEPFPHGGHTLWRARVIAQLGDAEQAAYLLEQAMEQGWRVWIYPHQDPYLEPIRGHPAYNEFVRPKG